MIVSLEAGRASLIDVNDLKSFKLVSVDGADPNGIARTLSDNLAGTIQGDVAWISEDWLRREAGDRGDEWQQQFACMLAFASSKGWWNGHSRAIRAHIETNAPD